MRRKTYMLFTILIGTFLLLAGCTGKGLLHERMQNAANDITENMLMGMKEDDYAKFSSQFDQTMKKICLNPNLTFLMQILKTNWVTILQRSLVVVKKRITIRL
jgi:hypothetical protein